MSKIFVTGHKSPDTDSVCAAIAYANLLKQTGHDAVAICAGDLNKETKYVLIILVLPIHKQCLISLKFWDLMTRLSW